MSTSIKFILQELKNNAEDRERFNKIIKQFDTEHLKAKKYTKKDLEKLTNTGFIAPPYYLSNIIRTALSRIDGKAVLGSLEGLNENYIVKNWRCVNSRWKARFTPNLNFDLDFCECPECHVKAVSTNNNYEYIITAQELIITNKLYQVFDTPLRNGEGLEKALTALDQYFVEEEGIVKLNIK